MRSVVCRALDWEVDHRRKAANGEHQEQAVQHVCPADGQGAVRSRFWSHLNGTKHMDVLHMLADQKVISSVVLLELQILGQKIVGMS